MKEEQRHRITKAKAPCAILIYFETAQGATSFLICGVYVQPIALWLAFPAGWEERSLCWAVAILFIFFFTHFASKAKSSGKQRCQNLGVRVRIEEGRVP